MTSESARESPGAAHVNVTINDRQFRLACEPGEEAALRQLAKDLDDRITGLRNRFGEIGNARLVVMAALMLADELSEAGKKVQKLEEELAVLQRARAVAADREQVKHAALVSAFNAASERIEVIVKKLNQSTGVSVQGAEPS